MNIISNKYYITRTGEFATDANKKIAYTILGLSLCYHDYIQRNTIEYMSVFIGSSIFWTFIELFLNINQQLDVHVKSNQMILVTQSVMISHFQS